MMFSRKSLGLEIGRNGFRMALTEAGKGKPVVSRWESADFPPETVRLSLREPNIVNPAQFSATIREAWLRMLTKEKRVSLTLPDSIGRILLVDLDTRFRNHQEGMDVIRWKLKKSLPFDIAQAHLDFQVLAEREDGSLSTLVSIIGRDIISQYEQCLEAAGLEPCRIEFTAFSLYRLFAERIELADNSGLALLHAGTLVLMLFRDGVLDFFRSKELTGAAIDANRLFREINSSFLVYRERVPGQDVEELFYMAPDDDVSQFGAILAEATGVEPKRLDFDRFVERGADAPGDRKTLNLLAASIGAAARSL
jgi:type IV pilus assembly protein PilM